MPVSIALPAAELICLPLCSILPLCPCFFGERGDPCPPEVHRTAGGPREKSLVQARGLVPFRWLVLPPAGNANRWAPPVMEIIARKP
jgi:hypothetical protein